MAEVACLGIRDHYRGESLAAYIVPRKGARFDPGALEAYCREQIAAYAVPREFHCVDSLPRNALGKVLKELLLRAHSVQPAEPSAALVVRQAGPEHVGGIEGLLADCSRDDPGLFVRKARDIRAHIDDFLIVCSGDEIVGTLSVHDHGRGAAEIRSLSVTPAMRGTGIALKLLEAGVQKAGAEGFQWLWLDTNKPKLFSDKLGFYVIPRYRMARVIPVKLAQVFAQPPARWAKALAGRFTPMELRLH